jgi:hypothetical protein
MCFMLSALSLIHFALEIGILFVYSHQIYFDLDISYKTTQFANIRVVLPFFNYMFPDLTRRLGFVLSHQRKCYTLQAVCVFCHRNTQRFLGPILILHSNDILYNVFPGLINISVILCIQKNTILYCLLNNSMYSYCALYISRIYTYKYIIVILGLYGLSLSVLESRNSRRVYCIL